MSNPISWQDSKKVSIQGIEWLPDQEPRGVITLVHGLGEHFNRYQHVAAFFNQAGFAVQSFDLPGHGKSGGKRGHFDSYAEVADSIDHLLNHSMQTHPGKPNFLFGHSLGGSLVIYYGLNRTTQFKLIIAQAPGLSPGAPVPPAKLILANWMDKLFPTFTLPNGLDLEGLSRDPAVVTAYKQDPMVHGLISARLGMQLLSQGAKSLQSRSYPLPLLLMQGSADRLVNAGMNIEWGEHLQGDVTLKVWSGFYHELHNEPEKESVLMYLLDRIQERI